MPDSLFGSLLNMVDSRDVGAISNALGEPEHSVSRGIQNSIAAVMGQLTRNAGDPGALRRALDLLPAGLRDFNWLDFREAAADPNSQVTASGSRLVSSLFGSSEGSVLNAITRHVGMRPGAVSNLMALIAPMVLSFIQRKVQQDGLSMSALGNMLQRESGAIRNAMPTELRDQFWPRETAAAAGSPVVIPHEVHRERARNWILPLALGALALGLGWWFAQHRRPAVIERAGTAPTGTASREKEAPAPAPVQAPGTESTASGAAQQKETPAPPPVQVPATESTASRAAVPSGEVDLKYSAGSSSLTSDSRSELKRLAEQAAAHPDQHITVSGYTDNVGAEDRNLQLSQKRADNVMKALVGQGVAADRVTSKGYGEADPVATNDTNEGRAQNRRVTITIE